ncbi:MAG: flagellar hook protein FlgE [Chthoniobacter sp.]|jgi:flagellar hook protein FlgE|nr:flagellar hook protein FlgE [Chthoniobacter sp.]
MSLIGLLTNGVSALKAFSKGMEVIGDNIANVNSTAFKSSRIQYADNFADILQHSASSPSDGNGSNVTTMQLGEGVHVSAIKVNFNQGSLNTTGQATDFGISGQGFFRVRDVQGSNDYVTRAGDFRVDDQGFLVTPQGFRVQGLSDGLGQMDATVVNGQLSYTLTSSTPPSTVGDVKLDSGISITDGTLTNNTGGLFTDAEVDANAPKIVGFGVNSAGDLVLRLNNGDNLTRGRLLLQNFQDPNALVREAGNLFSALQTANPIGGLTLSSVNNTPGQGGTGQIEQGSLELSNVDLTEEFSSLINTQRSFQAGSRLITTADQVLEEIVNLKR